MSQLLELLDSLKQAKDGSAELDRAVWQAFGAPANAHGLPNFAGLLGIGSFSTDAHHALKFAKAVLPALTKVQIETYTGGEFHHCEVESEDGDARANNAPNPALAVLIATVDLVASSSKPKDGHDG